MATAAPHNLMKTEPHHNCRRCPRLHRFIGKQRKAEPSWHNGPVQTWTCENPENVKLLIVGLAPGLRGANRTGRAFTGDASGDLLHQMLLKFGFARGDFQNRADDTMALVDCAITNAVRCVPPDNRPTGTEISNCRKFLAPTIKQFPNLQVVLTLGKIAHDSTVRALGLKTSAHVFGHQVVHNCATLSLISSYHCSRYNVNTGRLTEAMFEQIFVEARQLIDG